MSFPFNITNPGFVLGGQLTSGEAAFVTNLAGLSYAQGDIIYHDGSNLTNLGAGTTGQVLQTQGTGANPQWATVSGTGDVTAAVAFGTDNVIIRSDGTGKGVQATGITIADTTNDMSGVGSITTNEAAAPGTPATGEVVIYAKTDGKLYIKDDAGTETDLTASSSGIANVVEDTTPQLGGQLDVNGNAIGDGTNELLTFTEDVSAVNHVNIENEATGSGPIISAAGDDTNVDLNLAAKGSGSVLIGASRVLTVADEGTGNGLDADTVDGIEASAFLQNIVEDTTPQLGGTLDMNTQEVQGDIVPTTDGTYDLGTSTKRFAEAHVDNIYGGNWNALDTEFAIIDSTGDNIMYFVSNTSAVNYLATENAATGVDVKVYPIGTDTNIDIDISGKGTGNVILGNFTLDGDQTVGAGQDNYVLTYDNGTGLISLEANTGGGIANVVEDTTPQLGGMLDVNGNSLGDGTLELLSFSETVSAVNEFTIANAATGTGPELQATGTDTNIDIELVPKGTGLVKMTGGDGFDANNHSFGDSTEVDNGNSGAADTIDWGSGNFQKSTMTGNCTYTFTAPPVKGRFQLKLVQDATGSRTATWPAAVKWPGGTAPTLTTTANAEDIITFYYDGTSYYGVEGLNFS
tara:strand:- start:22073 stop:23968 length:1896 start_codon:yes stop_codon:yes gene_type:complete